MSFIKQVEEFLMLVCDSVGRSRDNMHWVASPIAKQRFYESCIAVIGEAPGGEVNHVDTFTIFGLPAEVDKNLKANVLILMDGEDEVGKMWSET